MSEIEALTPTERAGYVFAAFDAQDVETLAGLITDDVRLQLGNAPVSDGQEAFRASVTAFLKSVKSFRHRLLTVWADGDGLIAELEVDYTRLDGQQVTLPCCNVFRLRDGLISDYRSYMDITPVYA